MRSLHALLAKYEKLFFQFSGNTDLFVKTSRESIKLSQMRLSKEFEISQSSLARYETDDATPPPELLLKYADYFDVSMDYIFGRTDDPHGATY